LKRLAAKHRELGPRCEYGKGRQFWYFEGRRMPVMGLQAMAGRKFDQRLRGYDRGQVDAHIAQLLRR